MADPNEKTLQELVAVLGKDKRALLFVGAGSSKFVGYPLWGELINELQQMCSPALCRQPTEYLTEFAGRIKEELHAKGMIDDYHRTIRRLFQPKPVRNYEDFHVALVKLGFRGLITTNYDFVLEHALIEAFRDTEGSFLPDAIDLCAETKIAVFDFLRGLSTPSTPKRVLHLHGVHTSPNNVILTRKDYETKYGVCLEYDELRRPINGGLATLHRKVLWSLLAMHPLVFVGFSMDDEFFTYLLEVVQKDLQLGTEPVHFAFFGTKSDEDSSVRTASLRKRGIKPIFYPVPKPQNPNDPSNHDGLKRLISDLAGTLGISVGSPGSATLTNLTMKMLDL